MVQRPKISLTRLFIRHWLWVPMILLGAGLVFSLIAWVTIAQINRLDDHGVDTVATVTARNVRTSTDSDGNRTRRYYVSYSFRPTSDQEVSARDQVSRSTYDAVAVGQEVAVLYLPDDPGVSRLGMEGSGRWSALLFGVVGLLLLIGGGGAMWFLLRGKMSAIRAARWGEVREAEVVDHQPTGTMVNGRTQYRYRWIDAAREEGQSTMMDYARLPAPGTVVKVYVDPRTGRGWSQHDY